MPDHVIPSGPGQLDSGTALCAPIEPVPAARRREQRDRPFAQSPWITTTLPRRESGRHRTGVSVARLVAGLAAEAAPQDRVRVVTGGAS